MAARPERVAVVSGAASGIGAATVEALADAGFAVVGIDLAERPGGLAAIDALDWVRGDVTANETWDLASKACVRRDPGGASAFVACAADVTVEPLLDTPVEEWRRLFDVNVVGVLRGLHALLPAMVERGGGSIAIACSVNSRFVEEGVGAYSASKAALLSLTRTAALEHARHGVRINAVCPGVVDTPLLRKHVESLDDPATADLAMKRSMPTGSLTTPDEVAGVLCFLVSDEARGMSGSAVVVDGGLTTTYGFDGG